MTYRDDIDTLCLRALADNNPNVHAASTQGFCRPRLLIQRNRRLFD